MFDFIYFDCTYYPDWLKKEEKFCCREFAFIVLIVSNNFQIQKPKEKETFNQ